MKIENQYCLLEQGKRLKELGVEGSHFHHFQGGIHKEAWGNDYYPAFSVAELGCMLPNGYDTMQCTEIDWETEEWHGYDLDSKDFPDENGYKTEAECRAAMLIRLLENGETTPEEVNKRLSE